MTKDKARSPVRSPVRSTEPSQNGTHPARDHDVDRGAQAVGRSKFDLGIGNGRLPSGDIPWGYGETRVTVMARDPDWLYVYWEITDEALLEARKRLGAQGNDAWCCLRVYDTSGRVFDGTNSISYFDIPIDRTSRDWFVHVGKPNSSCHVEVGIKSREGGFQTIAQSGRTDFPRKRPAQDVSVEWLTVEDKVPLTEPMPFTAPYVSRYDGPVPEVLPRPSPPVEKREHHRVPFRILVDQHVERRETWSKTWTEHRTFAWSTRVSHRFEGAYHRLMIPWLMEAWRTEWQGEERAFEWMQRLHSLTWSQVVPCESWEVGPYPGDSAAPGRVMVRYLGDNKRIERQSGQERMVAGPWEVMIHELSYGEPERRVLGHWSMHWMQPLTTVSARWEMTAERIWFDGFTREHVLLGASESQMWVEAGASELWALGASEQIWLGASEVLALGASEQFWLGASEQHMAGASELISGWSLAWLGASELSFEAASKLLALGASEQQTLGASESWLAGASEQWNLGASESFAEASSEMLGASEQMGASEQVGQVSWLTLGEEIGASEMLGASENWGASELLVEWPGASEQGPAPLEKRFGGASELMPGVTGPMNSQLEEWTAFGASEEVAEATYPTPLDDSFLSDNGSINKKGGG